MTTNMTPSVAMVSTPDDGSCGVGTYTGDLRRALGKKVDLRHVLLKTNSDRITHYLIVAIRAVFGDEDLIHVQHEYGLFGTKGIYSWFFFPVLKILAVPQGIPIVLTVHEAWTRDTIESGPYHIKWAYVLAMNHLLTLVANEILFLSDTVADDFTTTVHSPSNQTIHHGVNFEREFKGTPSQAKQKLDVDPEQTLVIEPGYVSKQKGCDRFLSLAKRFPDIEFLLAGGARTEADEAFLADLRLNAPPNMRITGVLSHQRFHAAFVAADAIVLPYRKGGQSGIVNWCATYEVPTVGSDCAYFQSLSDQYGCLTTVDATDTKRLASRVKTVLTDVSERKRLTNAMEQYKAENSFETVACRHESIYRQLQKSR